MNPINKFLQLKRKTCLFTVLYLVLFTTCAFAQKEANIWYFGNKAGLDFNHSPPKALTNSAMDAREGCASIADANGNLLFYTNGVVIWDKTHRVMKNGKSLKGHFSSVQSAVILPKPGSATNYYVFTVDGKTGKRQGGYYNEVDMSKNGGKGEVILKNQVLIGWSGYSYESIGATHHGNGLDYWVCYADKDSTLKSFLVTATGVRTTPVTSKPGNIHTSPKSASNYMKFSSDNKLMAYCTLSDGLKLVRFDDLTGEFQKAITIDEPQYAYGLEFSPNSKLLYTSPGYQYDISLFDSTAIRNSRYVFDTTTSVFMHALQLGPDGKIYCVRPYYSTISFIDEPNRQGSACNYYRDSIYLGGKRSRSGLPTILQSYLLPDLHVSETCFGDTTRFWFTKTLGVDSVKLYFGDSSSYTADWTNIISYSHLYKKPGEYLTKTIYYSNGTKDSILKKIVIHDFLGMGAFLGKDIIKCRKDKVKLSIDHWTFDRYLWSSGDSTKELMVDSPGVYWVRVFPQFKCFYTDTIRVADYVNDEIPGNLKLGDDRRKCQGDTTSVKVGKPFRRYLWSTGDTTKILRTVDTGTFVVRGYNHDICFSRDTIWIGLHPSPHPNLGEDSSHCLTPGEQVRVGDIDNSFDSYSWNTASMAPFIFTDTSGLYILTVSNEHGCLGIDSVRLSILNRAPDIDLGVDRLFCDSLPTDSFLFVQNLGDKANYSWGNGSSDTSIGISKEGWYHIEATNVCGTDIDSLEVILRETPKLNLVSDQDTLFCDSVRTKLIPNASGTELKYLWNTGDTTMSLPITRPDLYRLEASNPCGIDSLEVKIQLIKTPKGIPFADSSFCKPMSQYYHLKQMDITDQYNWSLNGSSVSQVDSIHIVSQGRYEVAVENYCGIYRDTFNVKELVVPSVDLGPDIDVCDSVRYTLSVGVSNNEEALLWSTGDSTFGLELTQEGQYWLRAGNKCGFGYDTIEVRLHHKGTSNLASDTLICDNAYLELNATVPGNYNTYKWSTGDSTPIIEVTKDGLYEVEIANACTTYTASSDVLFLTTPVRGLMPEHVYCDSVQTIELVAGRDNNHESYLWSNEAETPSISVSQAGKYWVNIWNRCGTIRDSTKIRISMSPLVSLGKDTSLCGEFAFKLDAGNPNMKYLWSPTGERSQTIWAQKQQVYSVVVTNLDGCQGYDQFEITDECRTQFHLPNAFSPNQDNLNDVFRPGFVANIDQYRMEIFNRWGELLFVGNNIEEGWDGTYQGKECPSGCYTVLIRYYNHEKDKFEYMRKHITLLR